MANNDNNMTVTIKTIFDKSNMGEFQTEVTKAIENAVKDVKAIEIKANTQSARNSLQKFTSYLTSLSNAKDGYTTLKIHANIDDAKKQVNELKTVLSSFGKENKVVIDAKADKVYDRLNGIVKLMRQMQFTGNRAIKVEANAQKAIDTLKILKKESGDVAKQIKITASISGATEVINNLKAIQSLLKKIQKDSNINVKAKIDTSSVTKDVEKAKAQTKIQTDNMGTDEAKILRQQVRAIRADDRYTKDIEFMNARYKAAEEETRKINEALSKLGNTQIISNDAVKNVERASKATSSITAQLKELRAEALRAGNSLNKAVNPQDIEKNTKAFEKAIQNYVNFYRANRGLTKGQEGILLEKLMVGNIKEGTKAFDLLISKIRQTVQEYKNLNQTVGRVKLAEDSSNTSLLGWLRNVDIGNVVSNMAYAARGQLNTVQAAGGLISSLSNVSGAVGTFAKVLGGATIAFLAVTGVVNLAASAFNALISTLTQIGQAIYQVLQPGIELYKLQETAQLSLAAQISNRAKEEGQPISYERGLQLAEPLIQRAFIDAVKSAFDPAGIINALQGTLGIALGRGFNLDQAYNVVKGVAAVAKSIQLPSEQILQEARDLLQGTLTARSSQVAYNIGATSEDIKKAAEQGTLYDYLMGKMAKYNVALEKYAETFSGAMDRFTESWALVSRDVFARIAPGINGLIDAFIEDFIGSIDDKGKFQPKDFILEIGEALDDILLQLARDVDFLIDFIKEVTGETDAIQAMKVLIIGAINATTFAIAFAVEAFDLLVKAGAKVYNGITYLANACRLAVAPIVGLTEAIVGLANGDINKAKQGLQTIWKGLDVTNFGEELSKGIIDGNLVFGKNGKFLKEYLAGQERNSLRTTIKGDKPVDFSKVIGDMAEESKQSYADQRKSLQAFIEDLKQTLKEAIADIKDRMEQNDLAYQQGYKSIEDYFTQKSALEYEEAQFKLQNLIAERNAIASLTPTTDSERYQWQRDLIKTDGEIALAQREANKKQDQLVELAGAIERQLSIRPYQQGLGYNNTNRNAISSYPVGYNNDLGQAMVDLAESSEWATKEMYHAGEGCVEFVTTFGAQFSDLLKKAADEQVWGMSTGTNDITPWLEEHGVQVEYNVPIELAKEIAKAGDIIAVNAGIHAAMAIGGGRVLHNSSSSYANGEDRHIKNVEMDLWDDDTVNIIRTSETMGQNITSLSNATEQLSQEAKDATTKIEQTRKDIAVSYEELQKRMPQAFSKNVQAYLQASQDGQTRWLEAVKNYNLAINNNENMLIAVEASIASVATKLGREAQIMRAKYGQQFSELADALDKMIPIELLKSEAKVWEQYANNRLQMIEDDAKAMNKRLREKSILYPQAIEQYMSYFQQIGEYTITEQLQNLAKVADELAKQGAISDARNITKKIIEMRSKFSSMIQSWIDEMGSYFNYRKELVNADSGLTSFVKEERVKQLEKGEARVKAVAYWQEAMEWAKLEAQYQEQLNKVIEGRNDELDQTLHTDQKLLEMDIADVEMLKQKAMRQAEINAKLGEQKTLWQETMDAANQALENGLYNFMTDYINTAESIGEAFRNMAVDILKDLQKFFAKKAITNLMHVITGTPNEQYNVPNHAEMQTSVNTGQMVAWLQNIYRAVLALQTSQSSSVFTNVGGTAMGTLFSSGTGGSNSIANRILHHATGGYISGKGTSTSDSIPAMLSNGEYVIKADSVRRYGLNFLDAVNSGHFTRMRTVIPRFADGGYVGDALQDTARGMTDFAKNIGTSVSTTNNMNVALVRNEQEAYEHFMRSPQGQRILVDFQRGNGRVFARFNS